MADLGLIIEIAVGVASGLLIYRVTMPLCSNAEKENGKEQEILRRVQMFLARAEVDRLIEQEAEDVQRLFENAQTGDSNAVTAFAIAEEQASKREDYISRVIRDWPADEGPRESQEDVAFRMKWRAAKTGNRAAVAAFEQAKRDAAGGIPFPWDRRPRR